MAVPTPTLEGGRERLWPWGSRSTPAWESPPWTGQSGHEYGGCCPSSLIPAPPTRPPEETLVALDFTAAVMESEALLG